VFTFIWAEGRGGAASDSGDKMQIGCATFSLDSHPKWMLQFSLITKLEDADSSD